MMVSKLTLAALTMTAVLAAPQAFAQGTANDPPSNQSAKQRAPAAPKAGPTRAEQKPAKARSTETAAPAAQQATSNSRAGKEVPRIQSDPLGRVPVDKQGST